MTYLSGMARRDANQRSDPEFHRLANQQAKEPTAPCPSTPRVRTATAWTSEDALFMLIEDLTAPDNTFFVIEPDATDANWFATVALHDEAGYEIVRRDPARGEHEVTTDAAIDRIASDLTIWAYRQAAR